MSSRTDFKDGVKWSRYIQDFLTKADINAFIFWLGASYKTNNESLIRLTDKNNFIDAKRLYTMGNFSKFIRPGFKRIEITENPTGKLHLSAYKDKNSGEIVIVAVNDGQNNETFDLKFDDVKINKLTPTITNDKYNLQKFPEIVSDKNKFRLSVSGYTTITYTAKVNDNYEIKKDNYRIQDKLDDWTKVHSKSAHWMLEGNNPYNAFDHDNSRATRTALSKKHLIYNLSDLKDFEASFYYHIALNGLSFEVSKDGKNWQNIEHSFDAQF